MRPDFEQYQTAYEAQVSRQPPYSREPVPHERPGAEYEQHLEGVECEPEFDIAPAGRNFVPEESAQHVREMRDTYLYNMPPPSAKYPPGWGPAFVPGVAPLEARRPRDQMRQISDSHTVPGDDIQPSDHAHRQGKFTNKVETSVRQPIPHAVIATTPRGYFMGPGPVEAEHAEYPAETEGSSAYLSRTNLAEGYQVRSARRRY